MINKSRFSSHKSSTTCPKSKQKMRMLKACVYCTWFVSIDKSARSKCKRNIPLVTSRPRPAPIYMPLHRNANGWVCCHAWQASAAYCSLSLHTISRRMFRHRPDPPCARWKEKSFICCSSVHQHRGAVLTNPTKRLSSLRLYFFPLNKFLQHFRETHLEKNIKSGLLDFCCCCWALVTTQNASKEFKTPQHEYDEGPKIFSCCQKRSKFLLCWNKDVALRRQFRPSWQLVFALLTAHLIKAKQSSKQSCQIKAYLFRLVWDPHSTVIQHDTAKAIFSCEL